MANPSDFSCILVTGGAGFIGSALVRQLVRETDATVVNVDALTYAANPDSLQDALHHPRHHLEVVDIRDQPALRAVFQRYRPQAVVHLAAESHVDRSITGPAAFIQTNIVGTSTLLEVTREYWQRLDRAGRERFRFHHVSTDEVFGSLGAQGAFDDTSPYRPNSPYAASKAAADYLVRAWLYVKDHARALLEAASFIDRSTARARRAAAQERLRPLPATDPAGAATVSGLNELPPPYPPGQTP